MMTALNGFRADNDRRLEEGAETRGEQRVDVKLVEQHQQMERPADVNLVKKEQRVEGPADANLVEQQLERPAGCLSVHEQPPSRCKSM
jgi:hypothetical protein